MPNWKKLIVSGSDASLNTLNIATALTASGLAYPDTDGSTGQILATDGSGGLYFRDSIQATGQNTRLTQTVAALTWSFQHDLAEKYPVIDVFDANDEMIIPQKIKAIDSSSLEIYFTSPRSGVAVATAGGLATSASYATTASYAVTASHAVNALTASYAISASHEITYELSSSYAENATTASYILSTGVDGPLGLNSILSSSYSLTSSYNINAVVSGSITGPDWINFTTGSDQPTAVGRLGWDDGYGTLSLGLKGSNVNLQVGQEQVARVFNADSIQLTDGMIVFISGSQGNRIAVKRANASNELGSANTLGMVTEPIPVGEEGFVTTFGTVNGLNTIGLTPGAPLWLNSGSGEYSQDKPNAPYHNVLVGYVSRVHASVGSVFVKIDNGYEIEELHNVVATGSVEGDVLVYRDSLWRSTKLLSGSYTITDDLTVNDTLLSTQENTDVDTGTETVATVSTLTYDGAFFDYVVKDGTNYRAGTVMSVWDGSSIQYTDNSTSDIGDTSGVTLAVDISGTDARLRATVTSDNWNIKTFVRAL